MDIVDTHQHLWDLDRHQYSWCAGIPKLNRSFLPEHYHQAASELPKSATVVRAVHVEADVDEPFMEAETQWVISLAESPQHLTAGVVVCCRPEREGFRQFLDKFAGNPGLKGVRRVLHTQPDDLSRSSLFAENLNTLPGYGLTFDLCVLSRQMPIAIDLARRCPNVSFVLDHCGVPDVKGRGLDPWRDHLRELSRASNVVACKVSGLVAYADNDNWTPNDLRPFVDHVIECFGWDRVMFGSDWPVCTLSATFGRWVQALSELLAGESAENLAKLMSRNADRVYRLV